MLIFLIALVLASKAGLKAQGTDNYGAGLKFNLDSTGKNLLECLLGIKYGLGIMKTILAQLLMVKLAAANGI